MFGLSMFAAGAGRGHGWRTRRSTLVGALVGALIAGIAAGCALELERDVSCGDGWWDPQYEECDPRDPESFINACRDAGWDKDAACDLQTCKIIATEKSCASCGDGVASDTEQCDGEDLRGATCSAGVGKLGCTEHCILDHSECPPVCGDGIVSGAEECEPGASCATDDNCPEGTVCYQTFGQCVAVGENFAPNLACGAYTNQAIGIDKAYTSGTIARCTSDCLFGRNNCGFCGDGELDPTYRDLVFPTGEPTEFPAEVCDGDQVQNKSQLEAYCKPCVHSPINADVEVLCDFECNAACSGFAPSEDIAPGPDALGCCLGKGSPCPSFGTTGVPDLPCCSWLENPTWLEDEKCVVKETQAIPVVFVCP